jgi:tRNA G10  N-methylase Trm11
MLFNEKRAEEIKISNEFYNGYRDNRETLFFNILRKNPTENPFELLSATQKLMDRLVFICFVRDAIPMIDVLADARKILLLRHGKKDTKLWEAVQETFVSFDEGYVPNIPQFNGGLFKPDALIDRLVIKDDILLPVIDFLLLYDFQSQLNVSILGHIFEQSIADLEELRGEIAKLLTPAPPLSGGDFATSSMSFAPLPEGRCDVSQGQGLEDHISTIHNNISKRKKDGIFYTPDYVTKYMLQQTIGEWLEEKKQALLQKHETENADFWADYETVLKSITVLDPACGSGAFLTAVFDYLWAEWKIVINAGIKLGTKKELYRKEEWQLKKAIVLNNIFGVDLNMESVEITKLALWLQTASAYEPLSDLSGNVKRGNSLIDDASITEWAFDWQKEFPQVFAKQGFDVVVGNPPYGAYLEDKQQDYLRKNYKSSEYQLNSYSIFYEKALSLLTKNAYLGFITPNTFTYQHYFGKIRAIFDNFSVQAVTKHQYQVFPDADIGDTVSWIMKNAEQREQVKVRITKSIEDEGEIAFTKVSFAQFRNSNGTYNTGNLIALQKLCLSCVDLGELVQIIVGIKAYEEGAGKPKQTRDTVDKKPFTATKKVNNTYLPCVNGKDFHRYTFTQVPPMFLSYGEWLAAPRTNAPFFEEEKIIVRQTADSLICHLDTHKYINLNNVYNIAKPVENIALKYILALLNSKLMNFIYQSIAQEKGKLFAEVKKVYLEKLPIKIISLDEQQIFVEKVSSLLDANQQLFRIQKDFLDLVESNFGKDKFTKKLEKWFELDWNTLSDEFEKSKIKLSLKQQKQWKAFFEEEQPQATKYVEQITQTDQEIDNLVYKLYELSAEEIEMIEKL